MENGSRHLILDGEKAYELSFGCGTCGFIFERLPGADRTVSVEELRDTLNRGMATIDESTLDRIAPVLPKGQYSVHLLDVCPRLTMPYSEEDYFSREQTDLWGMDHFWALPHNPRTEYYRTHAQVIAKGTALYEFVVPIVPHTWLKDGVCKAYEQQIEAGSKPTALALGVLDVVQPAVWEGDPSITKHFCLAHFLLDGHHKMWAASLTGRPITLLTFIAMDHCLATDEAIRQVTDGILPKRI
jgi:hypothetical protein